MALFAVFLAGFAVIALGLKGFSPSGIPVTENRTLTGRTAKIVGARG